MGDRLRDWLTRLTGGLMPNLKFVNSLDDIPQTECWVIVKGTSVHHEGDERSRTHPGHGYPEHTDHFVQVYEVFTDEEIFKSQLAHEVKEAHFGGSSVRGFKFTPYTTKTTVEVVKA
jgi:hypothetical protein